MKKKLNFKLHRNPKVNELSLKAQELKLEFIVLGPITNDEEVIAIVNKSTDPKKHATKPMGTDGKCCPTLTVTSRARFAAQHSFHLG